MVMDYLKNALSINVSNLTIDEIAKIVETKEDGTLIDDVEKMNSNKKILQAVPSIEFKVKYSCKFSEIENEINAERPVIVYLYVREDHRGFVHSVVITGLDKENNLIFYNDPIFGEVQEDIGTFISMWEEVDSLMIKVEKGKREQRKMSEYIDTESDEKK